MQFPTIPRGLNPSTDALTEKQKEIRGGGGVGGVGGGEMRRRREEEGCQEGGSWENMLHRAKREALKEGQKQTPIPVQAQTESNSTRNQHPDYTTNSH